MKLFENFHHKVKSRRKFIIYLYLNRWNIFINQNLFSKLYVSTLWYLIHFESVWGEMLSTTLLIAFSVINFPLFLNFFLLDLIKSINFSVGLRNGEYGIIGIIYKFAFAHSSTFYFAVWIDTLSINIYVHNHYSLSTSMKFFLIFWRICRFCCCNSFNFFS